MKEFGFFFELHPDVPSYPSIVSAQSTRSERLSNMPHVLGYLENAPVLCVLLGPIVDPFIKDEVVYLRGDTRTDGQWTWPDELPYLIKNYHVELPEEFLNYMESKGWKAPILSDEELIDIAEELQREHSEDPDET
ncbi:MAG: hypothetical protein CL920_09595 [Deltaproteobacteria bacterium]|nr:hypothetical protein [Deltaproteobacteria bacterium]|tara:strand:- start:611 stop:1015 length:405 start_codon:yes stop_codon:yes gene_type:complete